MSNYAQTLERYDALAAKAGLERKGKTMPYTSANGHMFSLLNKAGELGIRIGDDDAKAVMQSHNTGTFHSHGARMRGYFLATPEMLADDELMIGFLRKALDYVNSLPPK